MKQLSLVMKLNRYHIFWYYIHWVQTIFLGMDLFVFSSHIKHIAPTCVCLNSKICLVSLRNFLWCTQYLASIIEYYLIESWSCSLCRQIEIDSKFLELQQIMDYSLLLGVHYRAPQQLHPPASYNQSISADGLPILAEEGGYLIQSRKLIICDLPLYDWYLFLASIYNCLYWGVFN